MRRAASHLLLSAVLLACTPSSEAPLAPRPRSESTTSAKPAATPQPLALRVVLPPPRPGDQTRFDYLKRLLEMALERTRDSHGPFEIVQGPDLSQGRQMAFLREGKSDVISLVAVGTTRDYERELTPIRFPLFRGLLGHRVCLIDRARQPRFSAMRTLAQLKTASIGQERHWADVPILRAAGFHVVTAPRYELLFRMLLAGRFECFSRGIAEAYAEHAERHPTSPALAVETSLMLIYPQVELFFTKPNDKELAPRLALGLEKTLEDGSFETLFTTHPAVKPALDHLRTSRRRVFRIENPVMSAETRGLDERYWLNVESLMPREKM